MGEVKRYDVAGGREHCWEWPDGTHVLHSDYAALEAEYMIERNYAAELVATGHALRAEVAKLTAACAAKDGVIIRFLNAPLAQRDGTPVPSLLLASARAALSDTAGANMIDATGR